MSGSAAREVTLVTRMPDFSRAKSFDPSWDAGYAAVLADLGLDVHVHGPWASVGETNRVQGWKLHLSSVPVEAPVLLELVAPFLRDIGVSFKVTRGQSVLGALNEGSLGSQQVGKFLTVYPESDEQVRALAEHLVSRTVGFRGPVVLTDLRIGDIVYARYGSFNPIILRNRLGQRYPAIYGTDNILQRDRYTVPFEPPSGVVNPFEGMAALPRPLGSLSHQGTHGSPELFGPGYLIVKVLKSHPKGSVFLAIDLRSQESASLKVLKQGRAFCLADDLGRDMRTRLQHQARLNKTLRSVIPTPANAEYFEVNDNGYLPLAYIEGATLHELAFSMLRDQSWASLPEAERARLLRYLNRLTAIVGRLHQEGFAHRDLSPSNVLIDNQGAVYVIDLELAQAFDDPTAPYGKGTPGFMSPEQEAREPPAAEQDVFSIGCLITLLLTATDPRRILFGNEHQLEERLTLLSGGASRDLVTTVARCLARKPTDRPPIWEIQAQLGDHASASIEHGAAPSAGPQRTARTRTLGAQMTLEATIAAGACGLLTEALHEHETGLWLSAVDADSTADGSREFEVRRDAHRGVAGVLYTLSRLSRLGYCGASVADRMTDAARWLLTDSAAAEDSLPGLYFGEAGVAVALLEACQSGVMLGIQDVKNSVRERLGGPLDWYDITHGAAGQGIAALICGQMLEDADSLAEHCAQYLVAAQETNGAWRTPEGVDGMSGQVLSGFAHGTAGIVYFLAAYCSRSKTDRLEQAWRRGAEWLLKRANIANGGSALEWAYSDVIEDRWKWWCHGSPGIALTFLRLFEETGEEDFATAAVKALNIHASDVRSSNLSQCHGLSGLGEIYLEAARVLDDPSWRARAEHIVSILVAMANHHPNGNLSWLVEDPYISTADLMVGSGGVLHFLARFHTEDCPFGVPLLLNPLSAGPAGGSPP
jgi:hypothetical protein